VKTRTHMPAGLAVTTAAGESLVSTADSFLVVSCSISELKRSQNPAKPHTNPTLPSFANPLITTTNIFSPSLPPSLPLTLTPDNSCLPHPLPFL